VPFSQRTATTRFLKVTDLLTHSNQMESIRLTTSAEGAVDARSRDRAAVRYGPARCVSPGEFNLHEQERRPHSGQMDLIVDRLGSKRRWLARGWI
jgi:hypothetical protein